jgi:hypothetical protein
MVICAILYSERRSGYKKRNYFAIERLDLRFQNYFVTVINKAAA